jgi:Uma2 family endonuclease
MPIVYETEAPFAVRSDLGPYREADYAALPDEPRCELLYGRLVLMTSPAVRHQEVVIRLARHLLDFADRNQGRAILSPMDVRLADHSVVQPDLIYVTPERRSVLRARVYGAPDLVVEILSPSTARRDLGEKLRLYADSGIREYWIVDPEAKTFEFLVNDGGAFRVRLPESEVFRSEAVHGLELEVGFGWCPSCGEVEDAASSDGRQLVTVADERDGGPGVVGDREQCTGGVLVEHAGFVDEEYVAGEQPRSCFGGGVDA